MGNIERDAWTIWPCEHGGIVVEPVAPRPGHRCAECGAGPMSVVRTELLEGAVEALAALGAALPTGDRCQNWTPCLNDPVVRIGGYDFCADHAKRGQ